MIHYTRDSLKLMKKIMDVQGGLDSIKVIILYHLLIFINLKCLHTINSL